LLNNDVIVVKDVSKVFSKNYSSTRKMVMSIFLETMFGKTFTRKVDDNQFHVLKNVTFSIKKNEKVAILGHNGSGKSTLLKMLNGIYMPDSGEIQVTGKVSSILELSSGFKPELTGLDNIELKLSIMGLNKEEIEKIVPQIIEFSELSEFINTPMKNYSSGMKSKLGFSIIATVDPDILILDEVFAAGDKEFRSKSKKRLKELYEQVTTILVTHNLQIVKEIADRVIVLKKGEIVFDGLPDAGVEFYNEKL
jgi:ABC-type polysaccharide/polyol phosphate transport system ATPase subunit